MDDDWLAANDLLPMTHPNETPGAPVAKAETGDDDGYGDARISDLRLKPVITISSTSTCGDAIETMRDKGFDQLPVSHADTTRLVGLITLGNLLSYLSSGRAHGDSKVEAVMFKFTDLPAADMSLKNITVKNAEERKKTFTSSEKPCHPKRERFIEITKDTELSALSRFFEWNSAAVVTEKLSENELKAVAVVTKVDLLTWLVKRKKRTDVGDNVTKKTENLPLR